MSAGSEKEEDEQLAGLASIHKQSEDAVTPENGHVKNDKVEDGQDEDDDGVDEDDDEDEDDEDEEPRLKYAKLTGSLATVYRNGDATSSSLLAGDKMVCTVFTLIVGS